MNIIDFKSGKYVQQYQYLSFTPSMVNREWIISDSELNNLLSEADRKVGELNAFSQLIPDVDFFIIVHIAKEATTSSRIEGTQTSFEEAFIKEENIDPERRDDWVIRIAIAHYQFETIHPFLDGNGRLGRLLITLYLVSSGVLSRPTLYLSDFFERNRMHYYDNLTGVRTHNNLTQWLRFFLSGVLETATNSIETFRKIIKLKESMEGDQLIQLGKRLSTAKRLLNALYVTPVVTVQDVEKILEISPATAHRIVQNFVRLNILNEQTGYKRNRLFVFEKYLELFKKESTKQ